MIMMSLLLNKVISQAEFDAYASYCVMALTDGPTNQASEKLVFRQIHRPMYPYDDRELDEI